MYVNFCNQSKDIKMSLKSSVWLIWSETDVVLWHGYVMFGVRLCLSFLDLGLRWSLWCLDLIGFFTHHMSSFIRKKTTHLLSPSVPLIDGSTQVMLNSYHQAGYQTSPQMTDLLFCVFRHRMLCFGRRCMATQPFTWAVSGLTSPSSAVPFLSSLFLSYCFWLMFCK